MEISLESVESHADTTLPYHTSILPNHTEGHRLNERDALSRKTGLRLGKDSTWVEEYPNQDKLHKISVLLWDLNLGLPDGRPRCQPHNHTDLPSSVLLFVLEAHMAIMGFKKVHWSR